MHVLILPQVFPPEIHPTAVMVGDLARHLVESGHTVTVATGYPHHPHGRILDGGVKRLFSREQLGGATVLRGWHFTSPDMRIPIRGAVMVSQALAAALVALGTSKPEVVLNYGPPLVGPLLSSVVARRFGARLATAVFDIYPDIAIEAGTLRSRALISAARLAEWLAYRFSDRIIVLSAGLRRILIDRGVPEHKIEVIPAWLDPGEVGAAPRENAWRKEQGIPENQFVALYAGTIGLISGAKILVDVAERMKSEPDLLFLLVGEGRMKDAVAAEALRRRLDNMRFLPSQPRQRLAEVQAAADVSVVTLEAGRGRTSVPSKVVAYMAASRPVLASVDPDSDTAKTILDAECGVVVKPGDVAGLEEALRELRASPARRTVLGRNGRAAFEASFARGPCLQRYERLLSSLAA
jgi:colanic acid biosynthesis glycosyl transferase WcaI